MALVMRYSRICERSSPSSRRLIALHRCTGSGSLVLGTVTSAAVAIAAASLWARLVVIAGMLLLPYGSTSARVGFSAMAFSSAN